MTYAAQEKVFLIGQESTWGTAVTADKDVGIIVDISDSISREVQQSQGISSLESQFVTGGIVDPSLNLTIDFQHGRLLEYLFGSVAHVETTGDWKHTFTVANTTLSMSAESSENSATDVNMTYNGMILDNAEFTVGLNQNLQLKVELKGKSADSTSAASAGVISTLVVFPQALQHFSLNGVEASEVQEASIKITKKVERSGGIGSVEFQQGKNTEFRMEFSVKLGYTDVTYQELWMGGTTFSSSPTVYDVLLNCHNGVTLGSGRRELYLEGENAIGLTIDKTTTVGNLIFIDLSGVVTLKSCFSVDNISNVNFN